ncbi:MAG: thiolase family protein [Actinobacteria bacterium]|jgi:acetyl-CoA acetyltransferase|nr:MAG: thiolase family protein [Actinomycetota bacterium]
MEDVYVIGVGMDRFGKCLDRSIKELAAKALHLALEDAGIAAPAIEAAWFSNSAWGYFSEQHCIRGQVALNSAGLSRIPIQNLENACAGASSAVHAAWTAIAAGLYDCVLAIGAEKMYDEDKLKTFQSFWIGMDRETADEQFARWRRVIAELEDEATGDDAGSGAGETRSVFMDVYAGMARWHMVHYGTTQRQLAIIASKNHYHSSLNPLAQYQKDFSVEEVMNDAPVVYPLTRTMCAPIGDGAAAAILCSRDYLNKLNHARPVKIVASVLATGDPLRELSGSSIGERASHIAYEKAGLGPKDIDVAEVHDATAFGELAQTEDLGLCPKGEGGPFAESGASRLGGKLPVNTSGGLESRGHPVGASGIAQIHELTTQLRGEAGPRQVQGARVALAENGGGNIGFEEAAMGIHILSKM